MRIGKSELLDLISFSERPNFHDDIMNNMNVSNGIFTLITMTDTQVSIGNTFIITNGLI